MRLRFWEKPQEIERQYSMSLDQYIANFLTYQGHSYPLMGLNQTLKGNEEEIGGDFGGLVGGAYKGNAVIFACMLSRLSLFTEARFKFRELRAGRPGNLFGNVELAPLELPGPGQTTGDLLARAIQDADLAGNWFGVRDGPYIRRLRPDWVSIVLGSNSASPDPGYEYDSEIIGFLYHPGGYNSGRDPIPFLRDEVAHFAPNPDPIANFRGMSWLTPVIREVLADNAARDHKLKFFENGATPNMIVKLPESVRDDLFQKWVDKMEGKHAGLTNAYKTMYLGGGADGTVVGANLQQMEFKITQGAGETRIAAAARVPPIVVGLSEGLQAATYSNYGQARRAFADHTMRPLWRMMAGALSNIIQVPSGSELWYDDRDISFLQEDMKDAAEVQQLQATAMRTLSDGGWTRDSIVDAVNANDWSRLIDSGIPTVQVQQVSPQTTASNGTAPVPAKSPAA